MTAPSLPDPSLPDPPLPDESQPAGTQATAAPEPAARLHVTRAPRCEPPLGTQASRLRTHARTAPHTHARTAPHTHARTARRSPGSGRSPAAPPAPTDMHRFAEFALRSALEVVDRRRSAGRLRHVFSQSVVDTTRALAAAAAAAPPQAPAVLGRVRCQPGPSSAEIFATYARGGRTHAVAGRIDARRTREGAAWQLTVLQLL
ncbi:Rv3235 family protein [Rhodococcus sp. HNM0569]|uniref:Rv3235 family protein n=1 Tax=Rhodococcus sp. HNM0569 TaxID=2716340 RepID=UPI00146E9C36|nr:Rv3235 family protein [Rhodococcus sp. HNM0569]NLU81922.1 hypothetical protein [Rhodococcus sp. HNM0569]